MAARSISLFFRQVLKMPCLVTFLIYPRQSSKLLPVLLLVVYVSPNPINEKTPELMEQNMVQKKAVIK
jgi:hypothetical protein